MKKTISLAVVMGLGAFGGTTLISSDASAQEWNVCYALTSNTFPNNINVPLEVYRLDIKFHSKLTTKQEQRKFGHPIQLVYDVQGKHVGPCFPGGSFVRPAEGTIHAISPWQDFGARMGLTSLSTTWGTSHLSAPLDASGNASTIDTDLLCRDVEISCKAGVGTPVGCMPDCDGVTGVTTFPPIEWFCAGESKTGYHFTFKLVKVDPLQHPQCSRFENGPLTNPLDDDFFVPEADPAAPATGLRPQ